MSSAYARATRAGVSRRPSRSGSSPIAASSSRTAASARAWSKSGTSSGARSGTVIGSVTVRPGSAGSGVSGSTSGPPWTSPPAPGGVRIAPRRLRLLGGDVGVDPVADLLRDVDRRDRRTARARASRSTPDGSGSSAQRLEDRGDLGLVEGLLVEQREHQGVEDVAVALEDLEGLLVGVAQQRLDLLVDRGGGLLGVVARVAHVAAQEGLGVAVAELDRAEALGHAVLGHHRAGQAGRLLDVVAGTGGRRRGRSAPPRPCRRACRRGCRASRCASGSTCRGRAAPSCSPARDRAAGSSPCAPGRCRAAPRRPGRGRPRGRR